MNPVLRNMASVPPCNPLHQHIVWYARANRTLIGGEDGVWAWIACALILISSSHLPIIRYFTRVCIGRISRGYFIQKQYDISGNLHICSESPRFKSIFQSLFSFSVKVSTNPFPGGYCECKATGTHKLLISVLTTRNSVNVCREIKLFFLHSGPRSRCSILVTLYARTIQDSEK